MVGSMFWGFVTYPAAAHAASVAPCFGAFALSALRLTCPFQIVRRSIVVANG